MLCLTHVCQTGMKERCVNVLVLKIEWETAKNNCGSTMNHPKKGGGRCCFEDHVDAVLLS